VYNAKVLLSGRLDGETYDKNNSRARDTWVSEGVLKCPPPVESAPRPKPITSSGKARIETPAPAPKPPFITAGPVINVQPNLPFSSVFMGWDGGPDHPNVEVWVSIDNGAETPAFSIDYPPQHPVFKQPKVAAIEMKLSKGRSYKYILKDAGTTLSTVVFFVP
jgi:hypothetical protein